MKAGSHDIYDLAERLGKCPEEIRASITYADIRRMKEAREVRERMQSRQANIATGAALFYLRQMISKLHISASDHARGFAAQVEEITHPSKQPKTEGGLKIVTVEELEARQAKIGVGNAWAMQAIMASNGGQANG